MKTQIELARDCPPERSKRVPHAEKTCTMSGDFCAMKKGMSVFKDDIRYDKISSPGCMG